MNFENQNYQVAAEQTDKKPSFWLKSSTRFSTWLDRRVAQNPNIDRTRLAMAIGVVGGTALYLVAPDAINQIVETVQTHGDNFANPGINSASIGEFATVGIAGGILGILNSSHMNRQESLRQSEL